jgi:hypothetical protein
MTKFDLQKAFTVFIQVADTDINQLSYTHNPILPKRHWADIQLYGTQLNYHENIIVISSL